MAAGMLSGLFNTPAVDPEEAARQAQFLRMGQMDPFQVDAATAYAGANQAGRGLGQIAAGATGRDVRSSTQKRTDAIEAVKQQVAALGLDPTDPKSRDEFYKRVVQALQQQGLVGEAADVWREYHTQSVTDRKQELEAEDLARKQRNDLANQDLARQRLEILRQNGIPEYAKFVKLAEEAQDPDVRKRYVDRINIMLERDKKPIKAVDLGDRVQLVDPVTGMPLRSMDKGAAPENEKDAAKRKAAESKGQGAYANAVAGLQDIYDAAVRLYKHPGLGSITGRSGALMQTGTERDGTPGVFQRGANMLYGPEARAAASLYEQVTGATFLNGLNALKAQSAQGSTGLGQTSNIEGAKVQAAAAALSRVQDRPDFQVNLATYIKKVIDMAQRLGEQAQRDDMTPIALRTQPLPPPGATGDSAPAPAAAPAAPAAKPGWSAEKVSP